jgi:signal transduction histidine kinase
MIGSSSDDTSSELALPDGRFYSATASSIIADDKPIGKVCVLRDVTNFKELDALKSEFVATVSHDLRSPLTLLSNYAKMLEMVGGLNDQQETYVNKIILEVENMSRLINNLLDLGRIEADIKLQLDTLLVTDVIEEVTEALQLKANMKRLKINIDIPQQESLLIEADPAMLNQAFFNLLENAIKFSGDGKEIKIKVEPQKKNLLFSFRDFGIGISPVDKHRLFEKFFRSTSREAVDARGSGLGLAIVKSIAERHGGQVWVESQLGKGSVFYFEIPRTQTYTGQAQT